MSAPSQPIPPSDHARTLAPWSDRHGSGQHHHYVGRFAPSPSGPLHAGSIVAALASYLDARAHGGQWLVRIEDLDPPRVEPGAESRIRRQLAFLGLHWDAPPWYQSARVDRYLSAFRRLQQTQRVYGCTCTRREIAHAWQAKCREIIHSALQPFSDETPYLGTCRNGISPGRTPRAWRFRIDAGTIHFNDRCYGPQQQCPAHDCGDFVLRRADGVWAYQLAVVIDDAEAGVTDIVRGADLLGSTGRQILLQRALDIPTPRYMHIPLVMGRDGRKLSKQNQAPAIDDSGQTDAHVILNAAAAALQLRVPGSHDPARWLAGAAEQWRERKC